MDIPELTSAQELGRGSRGVVYRATVRGHTVAVKLPLEETPEAWRRFRREGALLASVRHPAIPRVYAVGDAADGRPYLITELVDGPTLASRLQRGPVPVESWLGPLVQALQALHRRGLVHRDVKPSNLLLASDGARLIDFGLAIRSESDDPAAGTLLYASPEQSGLLKRPVDPRSDLYSVGVMLFECLAGRPPFTSSEPGELMRQHLVLVPPDLTGEVESPALAAITARLLRKDPDERYPSAAALLADLERLRELDAALRQGLPSDLGSRESTFAEPRGGRHAALERLRAEWHSIKHGRGGALLLLGPAGAGKSRLVRELLQEVRGFLGRCPEDGTPFHPLRQALENGLRPGDSRHALRAAGPHVAALAGFSPALDELLKPMAPGSGEPHDALAQWWIRMAEAEPLALVIEDAQWLDPATFEVLARLARELHRAPLFLLLTAREPSAALERLGNWPTLELPALERAELVELCTEVLGEGELDDRLLEHLERCTDRTPLGVREFLRAALDQAALLPRWGRWECDRVAFARLELPSDLLVLITLRLRTLAPEHARVLAWAALLGLTFEPAVLEQLFGVTAREALAAARVSHLVEGASFPHHRVRQAAEASLSPTERQAACLELARALEPRARHMEDWHRVARLYAEGGGTPAELSRSHRTAGLLALRSHAYEAAYQLLERVEDRDADLLERLGEAAHLTRRRSRALEVLGQAIEAQADPLRRAHLRLQRCQVLLNTHDWSQMLPDAHQALREAGSRIPSGGPASLARGLTGIASWLWREGRHAPVPEGPERERCRLLARLYDFTTRSSFFSRDLPRLLDSSLTGALWAQKVGPGRELVAVYCRFTAILSFLGRHGPAARYARQAEETARRAGDPVALAEAGVFTGVALFFSGRVQAAEQHLTRLMLQQEPWLAPDSHNMGILLVSVLMMTRGRYQETLSWIDRYEQRRRLVDPTQPVSLAMLAVRSVAEAALGLPGQAWDELQRRQEEATPNLRAMALGARLLSLTQQGDPGALRELLRQTATPAAQGWHMRAAVLGAAWGWKTLLLASETPSEEDLRAFERAVRAIRRLTDHPIMESHRLHLEAAAARWRGQLARAEELLEQSERLSLTLENDLAQFEVWLERARLARVRGLPQGARRLARAALDLARAHEWQPRARQVEREFSPRTTVSRPSEVDQVRLERQLAALLDLSLASARVLDPHLLSQNVLDHLLSLLGAERACLFQLRDGELYEMAGRDHEGRVLERLSGYSRSLVEEVARTGRPRVTSAGQDGPVDNSSSVHLHGLKSMVAAPLFLREETVGVIYLDTRLAKGLFTPGDADLLSALGSHIAVSLETARAAEIEVLYAAERRNRELAEVVRDLATRLTAAVEASEVWSELQAVIEQYLGARSRLLEPGERARASVLEVGESRLEVERESPLDESEHSLLGTFTEQAALALEKARLFAEVTRLATTDGLTGLCNRRHFFAQAEREIGLAQRHSEALSAVMLDVDHFKRFNDEHGHEVGDEVLKTVARVLAANLRREDLLARYGGEEFVLLLPRTTGSDALEITCQRLRLAVAEARVRGLQVTISLGVAGLASGDTLQALLGRADEALYASKRAGRNRASLAD